MAVMGDAATSVTFHRSWTRRHLAAGAGSIRAARPRPNLGDVAKNDKLRTQEAAPFTLGLAASRHGLVHGLRADPEHRAEGTLWVTTDVDPEVRDPVPGPGGGGPATALRKLRRWDTHVPADARDEPVERQPRSGGGAARVSTSRRSCSIKAVLPRTRSSPR